jgi:hypothetical protein
VLWQRARKALLDSALGRYLRRAKRRVTALLTPSGFIESGPKVPPVPSSVLIVGPSSVGKSTLIASSMLADLGLSRPRIVYGVDIAETNIPARSIIHYNMLHQAPYAKGDWEAAQANWNYMAEPIFKKIITSGLIQHCVVLVAPIAEIVERINRRTIIEEVIPGRYNREFWLEAMQRLDLSELYEKLFYELDQAGIPYLVLFSSCRTNQRFLLSGRADTKANLDGVCRGAIDRIDAISAWTL